VHIVLDRLARALLGWLEQRTEVDVEPEVGERGGDDFRAAVVPSWPSLAIITRGLRPCSVAKAAISLFSLSHPSAES